jgi:hypothetical protein
MNNSIEKREALATTCRWSGGCSTATASRSARTSTPTVPPLIRNTNTDPPTTTTPSDSRNDTSTSGCDRRAETIVAASSRESSDISERGSAPTTSAARKIPPTNGAAINSLNSESAADWMSATGQFAAARRAPRLSTGLSA